MYLSPVLNLIRKPVFAVLLIAVISGLMHLRIFNTDIVGPHAWRQTQTVSTIEHFATGSFDITQPYTYQFVDGTNKLRMEFPLLQWMAGGIYRVFGEHLWLLRFFMFTIGLMTMFGMGKLAQAFFRRDDCFYIGAWTLCFSPVFYYYCINPLPDLLALCFSIWGLVYFFRWNISGGYKSLIASVAFFALGTLCKLPFIVFYAAFGGFFMNQIRSGSVQWGKVTVQLIIALISLLAPIAWYATVMREWTPNLVTSGILESNLSGAQLAEILIGTLVSTLPELLLNYAAVPLFLIGLFFALRKKTVKNPQRIPFLFICTGVLLYYVFEMNAITLIHDYYLFPFLPILFLFVTYGALRLKDSGKKLQYTLFGLMMLLPLTAFLRADTRWNESDPGFNPDLITYKEQLRTATPEDARIIIGNDESGHISLYYTRHHGWNFHHDKLTATDLQQMISDGASYLYSDSHVIEADPTLQPFFGDTIATIGSLRVISLKSPF